MGCAIRLKTGFVRIQALACTFSFEDTAVAVTGPGLKVAEVTQEGGLAFPETGQYVVPVALDPVDINHERDCGTYAETNLWMRCRASSRRRGLILWPGPGPGLSWAGVREDDPREDGPPSTGKTAMTGRSLRCQRETLTGRPSGPRSWHQRESSAQLASAGIMCTDSPSHASFYACPPSREESGP